MRAGKTRIRWIGGGVVRAHASESSDAGSGCAWPLSLRAAMAWYVASNSMPR
jgi:hypothetical protein